MLFSVASVGARTSAQFGAIRRNSAQLGANIRRNSARPTPPPIGMLANRSRFGPSAVNSLSSLMAASFSLGQMVGPIVGAGLTTRIGFPWACTLMALVLLLHTTAIAAVDGGRARIVGGGYRELTAVNVPTAETAA